MRQKHALGQARGAGGIGDGERLPFGKLRALECRSGGGEKSLVGLIDDDHGETFGRDAAPHIRQRRVDEQRLGPAIGDDLGDFPSGETRIERRNRHPAVGEAEDDLRILQAVGRQDRGAVADLQPQPLMAGLGDTVHAVHQGRIGQGATFAGQRDVVRRPLGRGAHAFADGQVVEARGQVHARTHRGLAAAAGASSLNSARALSRMTLR